MMHTARMSKIAGHSIFSLILNLLVFCFISSPFLLLLRRYLHTFRICSYYNTILLLSYLFNNYFSLLINYERVLMLLFLLLQFHQPVILPIHFLYLIFKNIVMPDIRD